MAPGRYGEMVTAAKEYIEAGDIFQVVLAQRFTAPFPCRLCALSLAAAGEPLALPLLPRPARFCRGGVQPGNPGPRARRRGHHPPHRGHPPARQDPAEDKANEISLLADPKERAEHLMLLDLGRNDVGAWPPRAR
jgi:anthranilate synthase component 1